MPDRADPKHHHGAHAHAQATAHASRAASAPLLPDDAHPAAAAALQATLPDDQSALTPARTMLSRCAGLGLPACTLSDQGELLECARGASILGGQWERCALTPALRQALRSAFDDALRQPAPAPAAIDEGLWCVVCPISDARGVRGAVAVLLPGANAGMSSTLRAACTQAALTDDETRAVLHASASVSSPGVAGMLTTMLRAMSEDVREVGRLSSEATSFTRQLTGAFETIDLLYTLGRSMKAVLSPSDFLAALCARTRSTLSMGWACVVFDDAERTPASLRGLRVVSGDALGGGPVGEHLLREALRPALHDRDTTPKIRTDLPPLTSPQHPQVVTQPLLIKGFQIGVLACGAKFGDDPVMSSYDTQLVEACAGFLSTFIENVALYDDQHELFMGTLQALTAAIDAKDRYTCGHSERVALVSMQLAQLAGLPPQQCERVRIAGLVHDVGKIGVPESVLLKTGKLTEQEFALIKLHPQIGHRILKAVPLLEDVLPGVLHHHERYDGKGYPHGLFGNDIPLVARIIAVADTFDAMSSDRSYRRKLPRDAVLAEIIRSAGTQLDPRLAQLMLRVDLSQYDALALSHEQLHAPAPAAKAA